MRIFTIAGVVALGLSVMAAATQADEAYPARPIQLLVGYAPGGSADFTARLVGERLARALGQPVIIENRPGAGQNIAAGALARAPGDGYTLLLAGTGLSINPALYPKLPFDMAKDFAAVGGVVTVPLMVTARKDAPFTDIASLVAAARSKPGSLSYGSSGNGSLTHLSVEIFKHQAGVSVTHIPYKGSAPMLNDLTGGQLDLAFDVMASAHPLVKAGKLKALAVTSNRRMAAAPDVPTLDEAGYPGLGLVAWYGLLAPKSTPEPVVRKINSALQKVLSEAPTRDALAASGSEAMPGTPQAFQKLLDAEVRRWGAEVRRLNVKVD